MLTVKDKLACRLLVIIRAVVIFAIFLGFPGNVTGENRRTVLLLPFRNMVAIYGPSRNIRSPINGRVFISGPVDDKAVGFMNAKLHALLLDKDAYTLVPAERALDIFTAVYGMNKESMPERELWVEVGRILGADAVLGGFIYRFKNRTGTDYSVDDAASVAFGLHLIRVSDGRIQWSGRVDETQQPLSNNLFKIKKFFSRGGRWVTSHEMAQDELKALIAEMPEK
jgi:hypothetical protein